MGASLDIKETILNVSKECSALLKNGYPAFDIQLNTLPPRFIYGSVAFESPVLKKKYLKGNKLSDLKIESRVVTDTTTDEVFIRYFEGKEVNEINDFIKILSAYSIEEKGVINFKANKDNLGLFFERKKYMKYKNQCIEAFNKAINSYLEILAMEHYGSVTKTKIPTSVRTINKTVYSLGFKEVKKELSVLDLFSPYLETISFTESLKYVEECNIIFDTNKALAFSVQDIDSYIAYESRLINELNYRYLIDLYSGRKTSPFISLSHNEYVDDKQITHKVTNITIPFVGLCFISLGDSMKLMLKNRINEYVEEYNSFTPVHVPTFNDQLATYQNELNTIYYNIGNMLPCGCDDLKYLDLYEKAVKKKMDFDAAVMFVSDVKIKKPILKDDSLMVLLNQAVKAAADELAKYEEKDFSYSKIVL